MSTWAAVLIVIAAMLVGIIGTVVTKRDPGSLLGIVVIVGTVIAAIGVRYSSAYLLVPAPTLAYVLGAMASGYVHDRSVDTSHTELALHAAEWIGSGFLWMCAGTIAVLIIAIGRWLWYRRDLWLSRGDRRPAPAPAGAGSTRMSGTKANDARLRERETARPRPGFSPAAAPTPPAPPAPAFTPKAKSGTYPRPGSPSPANRPPAPDAPRGAGEPRRPRPSSPQDSRYYDDETWR